MSFALKLEESLRKNIRRVARKQMEDARTQVTKPSNGSRDEAVHEARKCFKKIRATLRLVRPAVRRVTQRAAGLSTSDTEASA